MVKVFLLRIGLISKRLDGSTHWPVYWTRPGMIWYFMKHGPRFYVFRNRNSQPWWEGRWLPWRWGFGICGLEIGDRGSHFAKPDYKRQTFWEGPQS